MHSLPGAPESAATRMNGPGARGNMPLPGQLWPGRTSQNRSIAASSGLTYFVHTDNPSLATQRFGGSFANYRVSDRGDPFFPEILSHLSRSTMEQHDVRNNLTTPIVPIAISRRATVA